MTRRELPTRPALPHTFRPWRGRYAALGAAAAFVAIMVTVAVILPKDGLNAFHLYDRLAVVVLALIVAAVLLALARVRVIATGSHLTVINIVRRRQLEWAEVVSVRMARDDSWAMLDLSDGTSLAAMGIQSADGERGQIAAVQLAMLIEELSAALEGDR